MDEQLFPADSGQNVRAESVASESGVARELEDQLGLASPWIVHRLGGQSLYVLAGNVFTLCVGLPLQIYVSRHLGAGGLGTYSLLEGVMGTIAGFLGFGLAQTAVRFIPQYVEQKNYLVLRKFVARAIGILCVAGAAGYAVVVGVSVAGGKAFGVAPEVVALAGAIIPVGLLTYFTQQSLRGFQEIRYLMVGSSYIQLSVKALVTVVAFSLGAHLMGYVVAVVAASLAALAWLGLGLWRKLHATAELAARTGSPGRWIRFAGISYATSTLSLPAAYFDRFLLGYFAGPSLVGILAVAKQLQQLPLVIYQMLLSVSAPMFAAAHARGAHADCEHLYALNTDWAVKAALPLILFLGILSHPVLALFGPAFADYGTPAIRIFMVAQFINMASGPNGNVSAMCGLEKEAFQIDVAMAVATAILMILLVPRFGLVGAALAVLFNSIVSSIWLLHLVESRMHIRWWNRRYLEWLVPACASGAAGVILSFTVGEWNVLLLVAALAGMYMAFVAAIFAQGLNPDDRSLLSHVIVRSRAIAGGTVSRR